MARPSGSSWPASASASEGGFDEADRVSLRGTNPSLTQTTVNGHAVGTGDWFVLSQGNNVGRSVSYTLLPSELVGSVEVNKSSHARLQEGVLGDPESHRQDSFSAGLLEGPHFSRPERLPADAGAVPVTATWPPASPPRSSAAEFTP